MTKQNLGARRPEIGLAQTAQIRVPLSLARFAVARKE